MRLHVTGTIEVEAGDRVLHERDLPGAQGRLVLARLAVEPGRPVPVDALGTVLWPGSLPKAWEKALAAVVSKIRSALASAAIEDTSIAYAGGCYTLSLPPGAWVDAEVAARETLHAEDALAHGDRSGALAAATVAVALARRPFLPGHAGAWAESVRASRRALLVRALDVLAWARPPTEAVAVAEEAVALEPLREVGWVRLMDVLAAAGDHEGAVAAYERCRAVLADELGIDPSPQTQQALAALLRGARTRAGSTGAHGNVPVYRTSFVGREEDLSAIARGVDEGVVVLTGPGGSGKTRLACEFAQRTGDRFVRGTWFADLAPLRDGAHVAATVASAMGVQVAPGADLVDAIAAELSGDLLLVVDNCEQVHAAVTDLLAALLERAPALAIVATSRRALGVGRALVVPPLPDRGAGAPAVGLFVDRAMHARADFALTPDNAGAVTRICARLDGLPLAIELAAARARVLSAEQIDHRLDERFALLRRTAPGAPDRQRSVEATVAWSLDLLTEVERRVFARLGVFRGGCPVTALAQVCADDRDRPATVRAVVGGLAEQSLVVGEGDGDRTRFRFLETIGAFAHAALQADADADAVRERHLRWVSDLAYRAAREDRSGPDMVLRSEVMAEIDNVRAALAWAIARGRRAEAMELIGSMSGFWNGAGLMSEGLTWFEQAFGLEAPTDARAEAAGLLGATRMSAWVGRDDLHDRIWPLALQAWEEVGDHRYIAKTLQWGGVSLQYRDPDRARVLWERSVVHARLADDVGTAGTSVANLAEHAWIHGRLDDALRLSEEAIDLLRPRGMRLWTFAAANLALMELQRGEPDRARALATEALDEMRDVGWAMGYLTLAHIALSQGDRDSARSLVAQALELAVLGALEPEIAEALEATAAVSRSDEDARRLVRGADAIRARRGIRPNPAQAALRARIDEQLASSPETGPAPPLSRDEAVALAQACLSTRP